MAIVTRLAQGELFIKDRQRGKCQVKTERAGTVADSLDAGGWWVPLWSDSSFLPYGPGVHRESWAFRGRP